MPKVLIETGNMRNAADAALLVSPKVSGPSRRRSPRRSPGSWPGTEFLAGH